MTFKILTLMAVVACFMQPAVAMEDNDPMKDNNSKKRHASEAELELRGGNSKHQAGQRGEIGKDEPFLPGIQFEPDIFMPMTPHSRSLGIPEFEDWHLEKQIFFTMIKSLKND